MLNDKKKHFGCSIRIASLAEVMGSDITQTQTILCYLEQEGYIKKLKGLMNDSRVNFYELYPKVRSYKCLSQ